VQSRRDRSEAPRAEGSNGRGRCTHPRRNGVLEVEDRRMASAVRGRSSASRTHARRTPARRAKPKAQGVGGQRRHAGTPESGSGRESGARGKKELLRAEDSGVQAQWSSKEEIDCAIVRTRRRARKGSFNCSRTTALLPAMHHASTSTPAPLLRIAPRWTVSLREGVRELESTSASLRG
jgi:hypothetical protein